LLRYRNGFCGGLGTPDCISGCIVGEDLILTGAYALSATSPLVSLFWGPSARRGLGSIVSIGSVFFGVSNSFGFCRVYRSIFCSALPAPTTPSASGTFGLIVTSLVTGFGA